MRHVVLERLKEREKELKCIYHLDEILKDEKTGLNHVFRSLLKIIPPAWQYPSVCVVRITYNDEVFVSKDFKETEWKQEAEIIIDGKISGKIEVYYTLLIKLLNDSQFLPEEQKLLNTIAERIAGFVFKRKLKETITYLEKKEIPKNNNIDEMLASSSEEHWKWRMNMVEKIISKIDKEKLGIKNIYLIGSTKNAEAGPKSDIDFIIHFAGNENQKEKILAWFEGWGFCLDEFNYYRTGHKTNDSLIDLHIITDEDIKNKDSFATMINSSYNSARLLK